MLKACVRWYRSLYWGTEDGGRKGEKVLHRYGSECTEGLKVLRGCVRWVCSRRGWMTGVGKGAAYVLIQDGAADRQARASHLTCLQAPINL